jgi:hypothetical protein
VFNAHAFLLPAEHTKRYNQMRSLYLPETSLAQVLSEIEHVLALLGNASSWI